MVIPFFTSYLVRVYSWQIFLSDNGIINAAAGAARARAVRHAQLDLRHDGRLPDAGLPLVVLLQLFSLIFVDRTLIEAAHNLRCGRLRTVFAVVVPSARVGLVIAALFCFILTFGDFVSPLYLGGGDPPTLSILITDTTKSGQQWPRAAVIALVMIATLLAVAFAAVGFAYRERGDERLQPQSPDRLGAAALYRPGRSPSSSRRSPRASCSRSTSTASRRCRSAASRPTWYQAVAADPLVWQACATR